MKSLQMTYSHFELKFKKPFITSKKNIDKREGLIIKITDGNYSGFGECAPFPEFGSETLKDAQEKLQNFKLNLILEASNFLENLQFSLIELAALPSLKHGVEQALLNLICNKTNISLNELLNVGSNSEINVNAVIGFLSPVESADTCSKLLKEGFETIKIKVGRDNCKEDFEVLKTIREKLGDDFKIRIDANGKWNLKEAIKFLNSIEKYKIEYVEQPVMLIDEFIKLKKEINIPVAADESIRTIDDADNFINNNVADFLILKPMMLGGIIPTLKIIDRCERNKIGAVITSTFESSLGRAFAIFAASTVKNNIAHGFNTAKYFTKDLFADPYPIKNGKISLR